MFRRPQSPASDSQVPEATTETPDVSSGSGRAFASRNLTGRRQDARLFLETARRREEGISLVRHWGNE